MFRVLCCAHQDYYGINPKGNVPTLVLDDGSMLNENVAVLLYLGDQKAEAALTFAVGTPQRYQLLNALAFVATELHMGLGVLFTAAPSPEARAAPPLSLPLRAPAPCAEARSRAAGRSPIF
jgi:glutathione S-transferase